METHTQPIYDGVKFDLSKAVSAEAEQVNEWMRRSVKRTLTPQERRAQMVSWIIGMTPSRVSITREEVEEMLNEEYGPV